jgi:hypothetical protein
MYHANGAHGKRLEYASGVEASTECLENPGNYTKKAAVSGSCTTQEGTCNRTLVSTLRKKRVINCSTKPKAQILNVSPSGILLFASRIERAERGYAAFRSPVHVFALALIRSGHASCPHPPTGFTCCVYVYSTEDYTNVKTTLRGVIQDIKSEKQTYKMSEKLADGGCI